jgi:hypothetical protein
MPEVERPVAEGSPIRQGRRHLWRGGHDPEMVKRAIGVQVQAEPAHPKPGDQVRLTLTLINAGAGHKIPTGDPDRHFTVEFEVRNERGQVVGSQQDTMGRWILWQPVVVEVYDNRLLPLASRDYAYHYRLPDEPARLAVTARVRYHIQTEGQHEMLKAKYGLTADDPYYYTVYERTVPLSGNFAAAWGDGPVREARTCPADPQSLKPAPLG